MVRIASVLPDAFQGVLMLVAGLVLLFAGRALGKLALGLAGFLVGAALAAVVGVFLAPAAPVYLAVVLVGGVLGAILFLLLWKAASVVLGGFGGWALGVALAGVVGAGTPWMWGAFGAVGGAIAGLLVKDIVLILGSAVAGAWVAVSGAALVAPTWLGRDDVRLAVLLGLAALGALVQFRNRD